MVDGSNGPQQALALVSCRIQIFALTCIVGIDTGPAKRDTGDGVIEVSDGPAVGCQIKLVVPLNALKEVLMALVDPLQALGKVAIVDSVEAFLEVFIAGDLKIEQAALSRRISAFTHSACRALHIS